MSFVQSLSVYSSYKDRSFAGNNEEWALKMSNSSTLYVGNLSFYTTEEQVYQLFSMAGELKRVIMGLDRNTKVPCGFCFVEYYIRENALDCLLYLNGTKLDERSIRTDIDPGFVEGRQYGRGKSGGQVRDEHRVEYDSGRGGIPIKEKERLERNRELDQREKYKETFDAPLGANIDGFGRSVGFNSFPLYVQVLKKTSDKRGRETRDTGNNRRRNDSDSD